MKLWITCVTWIFAMQSMAARAEIHREEFTSDGRQFLIIEVLNDRTFHFEYNISGRPSALNAPLSVSPYIAMSADGRNYQANYQGPSHYDFSNNEVQSQDFKVAVDRPSLCFSISKTDGTELTTICPLNMARNWKGLTLDQGQTKNLYGLGEQFLPQRVGSSNGDWMGEVRFPGIKDDGLGSVGKFGNEMVRFPPKPGVDGMVGNTQFPILYAISSDRSGYSLFLDQVYKQRWDFTSKSPGHPWKVETEGPQIRGFFTVGSDLPNLRHAFMDLVGHPLVPPKKAFGLWVSQYGFESWAEIEDKLRTLRAHHFPIDGFVLDLQWFGGVKVNSEFTRMGTLQFDTSANHFPHPAEKIKSFWRDQGVGLITIEESYIGEALKEFGDLSKFGFLVKETPSSDPLIINENPWWGIGGMIDWSVPGAGAYWHRLKRQSLVDMGIVGHWTDLGEPEMYRHLEKINGKNTYTIPFNEAETHNIFSLLWHKSIFDGYKMSGSNKRPFILSRSGGPGMQRYGAGMWSGDIGAKFEDLATHYNAQMEMSLSGQDYFGSDVGGFHREDLDGNLNELYTQWFADACAFDIPVRPHTDNGSRTKNTAPDRIGNLISNLQNIRERYELSPYYYSLAHLAYSDAEPVVPPLFFYYPSPADNTLGSEKLIGRNLLISLVARSQQRTRNVYLPAGSWINYHTLQWYDSSSGQIINSYGLYNKQGNFRLPVFAKSGAIIPKMVVDDQTMNLLGKRLDGVTHTELITRIFASPTATSFLISEDDGTTMGYQQGALAQTEISQVFSGNHEVVAIAPTTGSYNYEDPNTGATVLSPSFRQFEIELVVPEISDKNLVRVNLNGKSLNPINSEKAYAAASDGYFVKSRHLILAKSPPISVVEKKIFDFEVPMPSKQKIGK